MRNITMYNMQFGDSFLINDNGVGLLVDCGTIGKKKINQNVINQLVNDVTLINTKSILITHFHVDHYNCFNQLPSNSIDKVYMRNIYTRNNCMLNIISLIVFSNEDMRFKEALFKLSLVKNLSSILSPNAKICFVKQNDKIQLGNSEYIVLSPNPCDIDLLTDNDILLIDYAIHNAYPDLSEKISEIIEACPNYTDENINLDVIKRFEEKVNCFINFIDNYDKKSKVCDVVLDKLKIKRKSLSTKIFNYEHKVNISFRSEDNKLYMFGDQSFKILNQLVKNINSDTKIVKTAHHGTKNYFIKFNKVDNLFISNYIHNKKWPYDSSYDLLGNNVYYNGNGISSIFNSASANINPFTNKVTLTF